MGVPSLPKLWKDFNSWALLPTHICCSDERFCLDEEIALFPFDPEDPLNPLPNRNARFLHQPYDLNPLFFL